MKFSLLRSCGKPISSLILDVNEEQVAPADVGSHLVKPTWGQNWSTKEGRPQEPFLGGCIPLLNLASTPTQLLNIKTLNSHLLFNSAWVEFFAFCIQKNSSGHKLRCNLSIHKFLQPSGVILLILYFRPSDWETARSTVCFPTTLEWPGSKSRVLLSSFLLGLRYSYNLSSLSFSLFSFRIASLLFLGQLQPKPGSSKWVIITISTFGKDSLLFKYGENYCLCKTPPSLTITHTPPNTTPAPSFGLYFAELEIH